MTERNLGCVVIVLVCVILFNPILVARANDTNRIALSDNQAYPESITASSDGTLYVSSLAAGGIKRIPHGARKTNPGSSPAPLTHGQRSVCSSIMPCICCGPVRTMCRHLVYKDRAW